MQRNNRPASTAGLLTFWFLLLNALVLRQGLTANPEWYKLVAVTLPLLLVSLFFLKGRPQ